MESGLVVTTQIASCQNREGDKMNTLPGALKNET